MSKFETDWQEIRERLSAPEYHNVVGDLVAFTGLNVKQVCTRIMKRRGRHGARGWFTEEFKWHSPQDNRELGWFYQSAQSYLFSNSRRPHWHMHRQLQERKETGRVLDFGGGTGNDALCLAKHGYDTYYFELGIIQKEFVRFRSGRHSVPINIIEPYCYGTGVLKFSRFIDVKEKFDAILLQHVLEHIPKYHMTLDILIRHLKKGGIIIEHSPFNSKNKDGSWRRRRATHLLPSIPMERAMHSMKLDFSHKKGPRIWVKE